MKLSVPVPATVKLTPALVPLRRTTFAADVFVKKILELAVTAVVATVNAPPTNVALPIVVAPAVAFVPAGLTDKFRVKVEGAIITVPELMDVPTLRVVPMIAEVPVLRDDPILAVVPTVKEVPVLRRPLYVPNPSAMTVNGA